MISTGRIEVLTGGMFSGKTEELIKRLFRASRMGKKVVVFKPLLDTRYAQEEVVSHGGLRIAAHVVEALPSYRPEEAPDVVGIDETQFFGEKVIPAIEALVQQGVRVIASGLDLNFYGQPFEPMPKLFALADEVVKHHAVCNRCMKEASRSYLLVQPKGGEGEILVGGAESYEPRCYSCFLKGAQL